jgi:hypothetical protein
MKPVRRLLILPALALLAAAPAHGATIAPTRACTNANAPTGFTGAGFTPGALVTVSQPQAPAVQAVAAADGSVNGVLTAPILAPGPVPRTTPVTASDGTVSAQGALLVTQPGLDLPAGANTRQRTTFRLRGFQPGLRVYVHLRSRRRWIRTRGFGVAAPPCGDLTFRSKLFRKLGGRSIYVQIDQARRPDVKTHPAAWARVAVRRALPLVPERWNVERKGWRERTTP